MTTPAPMTFRCNGLSENQRGWINVNFVQEQDIDPDDPTAFRPSGNLVLSLPEADARSYFPGQKYTIALTAVE